jgi:hypothetical protein
MRDTNNRCGKKMPECNLPQNDVGLNLLNWVGRKTRDPAWVVALKRLRRSYLALVYGIHLMEDESRVAHYSHWDDRPEVEKVKSPGSWRSLEWYLTMASDLGARLRPR